MADLEDSIRKHPGRSKRGIVFKIQPKIKWLWKNILSRRVLSDQNWRVF